MQFGGVVAVNGLTLDVNEHEIVALIGPNGAGKTTAFNCVTGIYQPTFGSVSFNGEVILADTPQGKMRRLYEGDITPTDLTPVRKTPDQVTKLGIARTFQNIRLFGALTVFENVLIAKHMRAKQNVFSATLRLNHAEEKLMREESMEQMCIRDRYLPTGVLNYRVSGLISYINEHLDEDLSIGTLSSLSCISPYHMMRIFKEETGCTIGNYITEKRLIYARDLLGEGVNATDACFRSGFSHYSTFLRAYKNHFHQLPKRKDVYKRQILNRTMPAKRSI